LTIDDGATGLRVASHPFPHLFAERVVELLENTLVAPEPEIVIDRLPRREVMG